MTDRSEHQQNLEAQAASSAALRLHSTSTWRLIAGLHPAQQQSPQVGSSVSTQPALLYLLSNAGAGPLLTSLCTIS